LSGREGFGVLSAGFGAFIYMKHLFSTTLEAENFSKEKEVGLKRRCSHGSVSC
jgi:hypothetical protein